MDAAAGVCISMILSDKCREAQLSVVKVEAALDRVRLAL